MSSVHSTKHFPKPSLRSLQIFQESKRALICLTLGTEQKIQIAKNTLLRLAVKGTAYEGLVDSFSGTTAVAVGFTEPVGPAKALTAFAKEFNAFSIRSASLEGNLLKAEDVDALSKLPSREELLAKLLGTMSAVPTGFVRVLNAVPQKLVYALSAVKDQKEN